MRVYMHLLKKNTKLICNYPLKVSATQHFYDILCVRKLSFKVQNSEQPKAMKGKAMKAYSPQPWDVLMGMGICHHVVKSIKGTISLILLFILEVSGFNSRKGVSKTARDTCTHWREPSRKPHGCLHWLGASVIQGAPAIVQPGEGSAWSFSTCTIIWPGEVGGGDNPSTEERVKILSVVSSIRMKINRHKVKYRKFHLNTGSYLFVCFLPVRMLRHWKMLPREEASSLEPTTTWLHMVLSNLL